MDIQKSIKKRLDFIYNKDYSPEILQKIASRIEGAKKNIPVGNEKWSEEDIILITYGDSIIEPIKKPLQVIREFLNKYLSEEITLVHILPFFPYSSDDGFSVIDYKTVNPELGDWSDIEKLSERYRLMFDLIINHVSQHSSWFQNYLADKEPGKSYFIEVDPSENLSKVVRPRSLPLLTRAETAKGTKHVWTTFSADQIDLNFRSPELLAEMVDIFLLYFEKGASMIRLDAIAFLWKEIGTSCLHLPQTHEFVKLLRDITEYLTPSIILLTETNVPNKENLSYYGNNDEAHMVYQFSLPPLLLNTLYSENSKYLTQWAVTIPELPETNTFFNFTASHDGIGVRPLEGLLPDREFSRLINGMENLGAKISTRRNSNGTDSPYEINVSYFDAMKGIHSGTDNFQIERFICSQTIMLAFKGIPAFYIHSLLATPNYYEGVEKTGANRSINRRKWDKNTLYNLLDTETDNQLVIMSLKELIRIRKSCKSFHPQCNQEVPEIDESVFCIKRNNGELLCVSNIASEQKYLDLSPVIERNQVYIDLISGEDFLEVSANLILRPYQTVWLVKKILR